jgi:hypothetical protein
MLLNPLTPTLTGIAVGGTMIRPSPAGLELLAQINQPQLRTTWICRVTLAPPIEQMPPPLFPVLLTERTVGPGVG